MQVYLLLCFLQEGVQQKEGHQNLGGHSNEVCFHFIYLPYYAHYYLQNTFYILNILGVKD